MQHEAQLQLLLVILEHPILYDFTVLVQIKSCRELESVHNDLRGARCVPDAQVFVQVVARALELVGTTQIHRLALPNLDNLVPDAFHLLAVAIHWVVGPLSRE